MQYTEIELLTIWESIRDDIDFRKEINKSKLLRQLEIFKNWLKVGGRGYVEACTRFGKNMIAVIAIKRMNLKDSSNKTIIVVPNTNLYNDWTKQDGLIDIFNLKNVKVYVINTYTSSLIQWNCTLLIIDEIHRASNKDSENFSQTINKTHYKYIIGLSATLDKKKREFLSSYGMVRVGLVTVQEAEKKGWVAKHYIYNFGIDLPNAEEVEKNETLNTIHNNNFAKFNFDWSIASACRIGKNKVYKNSSLGLTMTGDEWKEWYAGEMGWSEEDGKEHKWSPQNISKYAQQWGWAMGERMSFLYNAPIKIEKVKEICDYLNLPTIIFSESTEFANSISDLLGERAFSYHTKLPSLVYSDKTLNKVIAKSITIVINKKNITKYRMVKSQEVLDYKDIKKKFKNAFKLGKDKVKQKIKSDFNSGKLQYLSTVKSLDEGFDSDRIRVGIIASAKSKELQNIQRTGRALNQKGNLHSLIINLYIKDTQDEKWLNKRQLSTPKGKIKWISNINEIEKI